MCDARRAAAAHAERTARSSYGRLLSILAARGGDIAAAEDALADAFAAALATWPVKGVPDNCIGWLLTAARRNAGHVRDRRATADAAAATLAMLAAERDEAEPVPFGDERLKLMFVCTHPAIEASMQAPLMLQTVLGLDAARIADCFLVSPSAMGQQLVRVKAKIGAAGIGFTVPAVDTITGRVDAVLSAIYAAYGTAWEDVVSADGKLADLSEEAIWLGRLVSDLLPSSPEAKGLLALMLFCDARRAARRDATGRFVSLRSQDVTLWSALKLREAEMLLRAAAGLAVPGRFQTEAAIQSLHVHQRMAGRRFAGELIALYDLLVEQAPSTGALVGRAVAHGDAGKPRTGLALLDAIAGGDRYQPWWAARARLSWLAGDAEAARTAISRAAGLTAEPAVRAFLTSGGLFEAA